MIRARRRHRWGSAVRFEHKTERECLNGCGTVKVTRHEGNSHWVEFWRGLDRIACEGTPTCEPLPDKTSPAGSRPNPET